MMDKQTGEFKQLPDEIAKALDSLPSELPNREARRRAILDSAPLPTLHVGEKVEIKGVMFSVLAMMPYGELRLMMEKMP